jgi:large subunit ribosomal protein L29
VKMNELREKDTGSLHILERELTENLFAARLQKRSGQLENTAKIHNTKRELAQVKTVLRARELGLEVIETPVPGTKTGTATDKKAKSPAHDGKTVAKPAAGSKKPAGKPAHKPAQAKKSAKKPGKPAAKQGAKKAVKPVAKAKSAAKSAKKAVPHKGTPKKK